MFKIQGKKADERILSIWWILVIAIIFVSISTGVIVFYSSALEVKEIEAEILSVRVADCLVDNGYIVFDLKLSKEELKKELFEKCMFNEKILNSNKYYLGINFSMKQEEVNGVEIGNFDFEKYCKLKGKNYPGCRERKIYALDKNEERIIIEILTASNNEGRKL